MSQLDPGLGPNAAIYADLGSGVYYGGGPIGPGDSYMLVTFTLNDAAVAAINAAIADTREFAIGGTVNDVPEPATLALLGTGLFGFGLLRRRV